MRTELSAPVQLLAPGHGLDIPLHRRPEHTLQASAPLPRATACSFNRRTPPLPQAWAWPTPTWTARISAQACSPTAAWSARPAHPGATRARSRATRAQGRSDRAAPGPHAPRDSGVGPARRPPWSVPQARTVRPAPPRRASTCVRPARSAGQWAGNHSPSVRMSCALQATHAAQGSAWKRRRLASVRTPIQTPARSFATRASFATRRRRGLSAMPRLARPATSARRARRRVQRSSVRRATSVVQERRSATPPTPTPASSVRIQGVAKLAPRASGAGRGPPS